MQSHSPMLSIYFTINAVEIICEQILFEADLCTNVFPFINICCNQKGTNAMHPNHPHNKHNAPDHQAHHLPQSHHHHLNSNYPVWSNPTTAVAWNQPPQQQQQPPQHQQMQPWNRGRSVPNLNPISNNMVNHRKPTSPNPGMSMSAFVPTQASCGTTSPMKYRRSTSFPGKTQGQNASHGNIDMSGQSQNNVAHGPLDVNTLDDVRDQFMQYQVRD